MLFKTLKTTPILIILFLPCISSATLIDRGSGLIYDDVQNITWMQDANYAQTSGYDADGKMTWNEANAWAEQLVFAGFDDWRLHTAAPSDGTCGITGYGDDCLENELVHLSQIEFGLYGQNSPVYWPENDNFKLFFNVDLSSPYWSNSQTIQFPDLKQYTSVFTYNGAEQNAIEGIVSWKGWAVRNGDVINVSEPITFGVFCIVLVGLFKRKKNFD